MNKYSSAITVAALKDVVAEDQRTGCGAEEHYPYTAGELNRQRVFLMSRRLNPHVSVSLVVTDSTHAASELKY